MFDPKKICSLCASFSLETDREVPLPAAPVAAVLVEEGRCLGAGGLLLGPGELYLAAGSPLPAGPLTPLGGCRLLGAGLEGSAALDFAAGLPSPQALRGAEAAGAGPLLRVLTLSAGAAQSAAAYSLLCHLCAAGGAPAWPPLVAEAVFQMHNHYAEVYGVEEVAAKLGVSKSHLVRSFRTAVGVPPGQYLTGVRVESAKRLLSGREYPLAVVATLCGFSDANYLCKVFKKETGMTPGDYRKKIGQLTGEAAPLPGERKIFL